MSKGRVLVVDDLPDVRATLAGLLSDAGYDVRSASSRVEALQIMEAGRFHVAVLDVRLDEADEDNQDGLLLMHEIRAKNPDIAIIILTGYANVKMVRDVLQPNRDGVAPAFGFLEKSELDQLVPYVNHAFEHRARKSASDIKDLIAQGENEQVEFKASIRWDFETKAVSKRVQEAIAIAIAGMLNSRGGTLLIGVSDNGAILGIENDLKTLHKRRNPDGFRSCLTEIVRNHLGVECLAYLWTRFESVDGKQICVVSIEQSPTPVFLAQGEEHTFWVRTGNSTRSLDVKAATNYIQAHWRKAV